MDRSGSAAGSLACCDNVSRVAACPGQRLVAGQLC
ncbi:hypothetical protein HNR73_007481 [Phytomonospora endophytica]|uniref:Uncharacterized protein n=1 Tax=Phytomonospora endophytica TaxID=714109 RepID=A0A841FUY7_9ACTN|nr:hypothetical protein [Phytomonospora endophytica]